MDLSPGETIVTDFDPHDSRNKSNPTSVTSAYLNLMKATFGTAMLSFPIVMKMQGYVMGPILIVVTTVLCLYCVRFMIIDIYKVNIRTKNGNITMAPASKYLLEQGAFWMKPIAPIFPSVIAGTNMLGQVLILASYILHLGNTSLHLCELYVGEYPMKMHILIVTIPILICNLFLRNLVIISFMAVLGAKSHILATMISFYYLSIDLEDPGDLVKVGTAKNLIIGFGTIIYGLINVALLVSLEWNMKKPKKFIKLFGVLNNSIAFIAVIYIAIAVLGYFKYREDIKSSFILNMPDEIGASITVGLFGFGVFSAYFIHIYVIIELCLITYKDREAAEGNTPSDRCLYLLDIGIRIIITISGALVVSIFTDINLFIGLIGVLVMTLLSIVYPAIMHYCMLKIEYPTAWWRLIEPSFIGIFGLILSISGCVLTSIAMVEEAIK